MSQGKRRFLARLGLAWVVWIGIACGDGRQVVVAWQAPNGDAAVQAFDVHPPWLPVSQALAIDEDSSLRFAAGKLFAISATAGTIKLIDPLSWTVERTFELGASSRPIDLAVVTGHTAYVTREAATHLLKIHLRSGRMSEAVDLGPLADADGIPDLGTLSLDGGRLLVQVRRLNADAPESFERPAYIGVVDLRRRRLVDVDARMPGIQGIALRGTSPIFKMQIGPTPRRLFVSASRNTHNLDAGIEMIDLDALRSLGIVAAETDPPTGICCDMAGFVMVSKSRGYFTFSTDSTLSSHLHTFTLDGGIDPEDLYTSLGYEATSLVHEPLTDQLFLPTLEGAAFGFHVFDAGTGRRLSDAPIPTPGRITDLVLTCACADRTCDPTLACLSPRFEPRRRS